MLRPIAHIRTDYKTKFGIPRQSGLVPGTRGTIIFEPLFRNPECVRGLEEFTHIWLLWQCGDSLKDERHWASTVAPPRLGGKEKKGIFATRSPFRPNGIALSCVKLLSVDCSEEQGPILTVEGADLLDNTAIYDIKPYLSYADSFPEASLGWAGRVLEYGLSVEIPEQWRKLLPEDVAGTVTELIAQDPRPNTVEAVEKEYRMYYKDYDIWFHVEGDRAIVHRVVVMPDK